MNSHNLIKQFLSNEKLKFFQKYHGMISWGHYDTSLGFQFHVGSPELRLKIKRPLFLSKITFYLYLHT